MLCQGQRGILEWRFPHPGKYMFHAHQSEFTELGWQGFFEVVADGGAQRDGVRVPPLPAWVLGLVPLLLVVARGRRCSPRSAGPGSASGAGRRSRSWRSSARCSKPGVIELTVRNDGPDAVAIAQAQVNDAFVQFTGADEPIGRLETATVRVQQPWVEGEAYEVALVTSTGGTIAHEIPVAVETPAADLAFFGLMALLGIYVGVIPVALGMLWLPWMRRDPAGLAARR